MPDRHHWTVGQVLDHIDWPPGRLGRTTCPIHRGENDQAFHYEDERWYCFACGEGGSVPRLLERLGFPDEAPHTPGHPVPKGTEFLGPLPLRWLRERSRRPVFRASAGQVTRVLERKRLEIDAQVRWAWEKEHTDALCLYRDAQDKVVKLTGLSPDHPKIDLAASIMFWAMSRLEEAHRHLNPECPGDCVDKDDPRDLTSHRTPG